MQSIFHRELIAASSIAFSHFLQSTHPLCRASLGREREHVESPKSCPLLPMPLPTKVSLRHCSFPCSVAKKPCPASDGFWAVLLFRCG